MELNTHFIKEREPWFKWKHFMMSCTACLCKLSDRLFGTWLLLLTTFRKKKDEVKVKQGWRWERMGFMPHDRPDKLVLSSLTLTFYFFPPPPDDDPSIYFFRRMQSCIPRYFKLPPSSPSLMFQVSCQSQSVKRDDNLLSFCQEIHEACFSSFSSCWCPHVMLFCRQRHLSHDYYSWGE